MNEFVVNQLSKYNVTNPKDWKQKGNTFTFFSFRKETIMVLPRRNVSFHYIDNRSDDNRFMEEGIEIKYNNI